MKKKPLGERTLAYYYNGELRAFRKGDWKIKMPYPGNESNPWRAGVPAHDTLLFNLKADRSEKDNLLPKHPEKATELLQAMEDFQASLGTLPPLMKTRAPADNIHLSNKNKNHEGTTVQHRL